MDRKMLALDDLLALTFFCGIVAIGFCALILSDDNKTTKGPSEVTQVDAPVSHRSSGVNREVVTSEVFPLPEEAPSQSVSEEAGDVSIQDNAPPLAFSSKAVLAYMEKHPNSPLRFVPKDATQLQLSYLEGQVEVILEDWQKIRDERWNSHQENLLAFSVDPVVLENDKDRQARMKSLVKSLWPTAMQ